MRWDGEAPAEPRFVSRNALATRCDLSGRERFHPSRIQVCGVAGTASGDGETRAGWKFMGVFKPLCEKSSFEVIRDQRAGCTFRRSETRLWTGFAPFRHPSRVLPQTCKQEPSSLVVRPAGFPREAFGKQRDGPRDAGQAPSLA